MQKTFTEFLSLMFQGRIGMQNRKMELSTDLETLTMEQYTGMGQQIVPEG